MSTMERTAAQEVHDHAVSRGNYLASLFAIADGSASTEDYAAADIEQDAEGWGTEEAAYDRLAELPLSVEVTKTIRVLFGTGGPADGMNVELDTEGEIRRVVFWFANWGTYAETIIPEGSSLYRYAEDLAEMIGDSEA